MSIKNKFDRQDKGFDHFADLIRKPARSISVFNKLMWCERIKTIRMDELEKEKSNFLNNKERQKIGFIEARKRFTEKANKDKVKVELGLLTRQNSSVSFDLNAKNRLNQPKNQQNIEVLQRSKSFSSTSSGSRLDSRLTGYDDEEDDYGNTFLTLPPIDKPSTPKVNILNSNVASILIKEKKLNASQQNQQPNSVRFKLEEDSKKQVKKIETPNEPKNNAKKPISKSDLKRLYTIPKYVLDNYNISDDIGDIPLPKSASGKKK